MPNMHEIDVSIAVKCVNHGIQCVSDNPVTAFHTGFLKHFPQYVGYILHHSTPPMWLLITTALQPMLLFL